MYIQQSINQSKLGEGVSSSASNPARPGLHNNRNLGLPPNTTTHLQFSIHIHRCRPVRLRGAVVVGRDHLVVLDGGAVLGAPGGEALRHRLGDLAGESAGGSKVNQNILVEIPYLHYLP